MFILKNTLFAKKLSRSRQELYKIILLTSLFWICVDSFVIIFYLSENIRTTPSSQVDQYAPEIKVIEIKTTSTLQTQQQNNDELNKLRLLKIRNIDLIVKPTTTTITTTTTMTTTTTTEYIKPTRLDFLGEGTNPPDWPGENGRAVNLPESLKSEVEKQFSENQFNIYASNLIAINRTLRDVRKDSCKKNDYGSDLPTTSIIIVFHNEGNSTLLRGLVSIVKRSPSKYLKEIILVDDCSEGREYLHKPLDEFIASLPVTVKIFRNTERLGLMRSRLRGAEAATADTLTFLDAHIEATTGWLEPLLYEVKINRKAVPCPIIDIIDLNSFKYIEGSSNIIGGFSKDMVFTWDNIPKKEQIRRNNNLSSPIKSPTMAGGLFTIERNYFYELGSYDDQMNVWGAENLEMSFRIWMCGGTLLILPCSHVGHIFRDKSPYSFPGGIDKVIFHNIRRVLDVWTDEYASYFYHKMPHLKNYVVGDVSERKELRNKLKCKSFRWFLDNIYPEAPVPVNYYHVGQIKNRESDLCIDSYKGQKDHPGMFPCAATGSPNQVIEYSKSNKLIVSEQCIQEEDLNEVRLVDCSSDLRSNWIHNETNKQFINEKSHECLAFEGRKLIIKKCVSNDNLQKWDLSNPILPS